MAHLSEDKAAEAIEVDFQRFYHVDFCRVLWHREWSMRKILAHVRHLPKDSSFLAVLDERNSWSATDYLLAHAVDRLAELVYLEQVINTDSDKRGAIAEPKTVPRPGEISETSEPEFASIRELKDSLGALPRIGEMV